MDYSKMTFSVNIIFKIESRYKTMKEFLNCGEEEMVYRGLWLAFEMLNEHIKKQNYEFDENATLLEYSEFIESFIKKPNEISDSINFLWENINKAIADSFPKSNSKSNKKYVDETTQATYKYIGLKVLNLSRRDLGYMTLKEVDALCDEHRAALGGEDDKEVFATASMFG